MDEKKIAALMADPEFQKEVELANKRGAEKMARLPKASKAKIDLETRRLVLDMQSGVTLLVPIDMVQGLQTDNAKALEDFELVLNGTQIHWEKLDVQFTIESFLTGIFGTRKWMAGLKEHLVEIGRKGGQAKTPAKRFASAENGKKGGRPRKVRSA
ncbi:MAG TPA: DUF2442 domain-containing protein [Pyrinomonadaceae bacterium]|nr:DUF2442 domain-containing protein [Pyrinomonadaceae bacterium]